MVKIKAFITDNRKERKSSKLDRTGSWCLVLDKVLASLVQKEKGAGLGLHALYAPALSHLDGDVVCACGGSWDTVYTQTRTS